MASARPAQPWPLPPAHAATRTGAPKLVPNATVLASKTLEQEQAEAEEALRKQLSR